MATSYGSASNFTATFAGPLGGGGSSAKIVDMTILQDEWKNAESPYTQEVNVEGVSANSVVDLVADAETLDILTQSRCVVYLRNDGGTITAVAVGGKPQGDLTVQAIITEGTVAT